MFDRPDHAPELLAMLAVDVLGPGAFEWARRMRSSYPDATPDGLARLAVNRYVRLAALGAAASLAAGSFAPLAGLVSAAWVQAGLVLHVAAAYGHDPTDPDRAADLLVLTQVHRDGEAARAALDDARQAVPDAGPALPRLTEATRRLALPFAAQAELPLRLAARFLPGAAPLAAVAGGTSALQRLAARTIGLYRPARVPAGA